MTRSPGTWTDEQLDAALRDALTVVASRAERGAVPVQVVASSAADRLNRPSGARGWRARPARLLLLASAALLLALLAGMLAIALQPKPASFVPCSTIPAPTGDLAITGPPSPNGDPRAEDDRDDVVDAAGLPTTEYDVIDLGAVHGSASEHQRSNEFGAHLDLLHPLAGADGVEFFYSMGIDVTDDDRPDLCATTRVASDGPPVHELRSLATGASIPITDDGVDARVEQGAFAIYANDLDPPDTFINWSLTDGVYGFSGSIRIYEEAAAVRDGRLVAMDLGPGPSGREGWLRLATMPVVSLNGVAGAPLGYENPDGGVRRSPLGIDPENAPWLPTLYLAPGDVLRLVSNADIRAVVIVAQEGGDPISGGAGGFGLDLGDPYAFLNDAGRFNAVPDGRVLPANATTQTVALPGPVSVGATGVTWMEVVVTFANGDHAFYEWLVAPSTPG